MADEKVVEPKQITTDQAIANINKMQVNISAQVNQLFDFLTANLSAANQKIAELSKPQNTIEENK